MHIGAFKQIETGHYILYSVYNVDVIERCGGSPSCYPIAFKDETAAIKAIDFLTDTYYYYFSHPRRARMRKEICVFDGQIFHSASGERWDIRDLDIWDRLSDAEDDSMIPFESRYGRALLRSIGAPILKKRNES